MMPDLYNAEKQYFLQKLHKNIIVREGAYNIRDGIGYPPNGAGTTCTIDASGTQCPGYNAAAETSPWIFGRMTQADGKANPFMWVRPCGYVPSTTYVKAAYKGDSPWHEYYVWIIWHHLLDMGFESIDALARATSLNMIQKVMHPDHNKYLVDQYENGNCIVAGDIPISNWLEAKTSISTTYESKNSWTWCGLDQDGYCYRALAVLALAGGSEVSATWSAIEAYNTLKALIPISNLNESPRWAFTPRYEPTRVSTQVGSTFAIIRYVKPRSNEACSYKGVSDGVTTSRFVEIVETGLTPGTQYNASLSCPSDPYGDTSVTFTTAGSALSGTSNYSITVGGNSPTAYIDHGPTNSLGLTASAPCTLGCTITLPAINRGLYYYRIRRSTGAVGETRAIIVQ
jgi:hypothetical protein